MTIRILLASTAFVLAGIGFQPKAQAIGCITGGLAGAVAGHMVNHGVLGAIGGCVAGHAYNKKQKREAQQMQSGSPSQNGGYQQGYRSPRNGDDTYQ
jgi:hypothetical protein